VERDEFHRAAWRVTVAAEVDSERLVFVDEMGANIALSPLRAWSAVGERAHCLTPRNRGKNVTLLSSMSVGGMGPSLAVTGAVNATVFESYLQRVLLPSLSPGHILVMDNLPAHKGERVRELIEGVGCELLYLPAYSPDYNPIEEAFAKVKTILRRIEARTREAVVEAMGNALEAVTAQDARGFLRHAGYRTPGQLL
jgi:transposase